MASKLKRFLKSFTLIELIIVIAIIAVLGASAFLLLSQWMSKSRDSRRITDLRTLEKTIQISFIDKEGANYPDPDPKVGIKVGTGLDSYGILWYQGKFGEKMTDYVGNLNKIPKDPKGNYYDYSLTEDKKYYQLLAVLENDKPLTIGLGKVYGLENRETYILTNYEGHIIKKIGVDKYYLIKTETIMVDPSKLEDYDEQEYEVDIKNDILKPDSRYSERVVLLTGDISSFFDEDPSNDGNGLKVINEVFPEFMDSSTFNKLVQSFGGSINPDAQIYNHCDANEYEGYSFDKLLHGQSQTKSKTENIIDGKKVTQLSVTCNDGVLAYGEESIEIECNSDKVVYNDTCVNDLCKGIFPANAELNGTQSVNGTWGYSESTGLCKFKCVEGYNFDNGTSCELNTYIVSGSFGTNANGATISVCGNDQIADNNGNFTVTKQHGLVCNNIAATRSGYVCSTTIQGPLNLTSNVTNISGICNEIINGTCGSANLVTVKSAPSSNLCSSGTSTSVTQSTENYLWSCEGINSGTPSSCSAPRQYTVTFDGNLGTSTISQQLFNYNNPVGTLPTATRTGYTFNGWFTASSGGSKITTSTLITNNITYYAQWTIIKTWSGDATNGYVYKEGGVPVYPTTCKNLLTSTIPNFKITLGGVYNGSKFTDGVYYLKPDSNSAFKAYCDMTNDGGGWTLIANVGRNGTQSFDFYLGTKSDTYGLTSVSHAGDGTSGTLGVNKFANNFSFTQSKLIFVAGNNPNQLGIYYKTITKANVDTWFVSHSIEPNSTKICIDYGMTNQCTTRPFDHDYDNNGVQDGGTIMFWGMDLSKYGYTVGGYHPIHGGNVGGGGFCSVTGNLNSNAWNDSFSDGHWGNGLVIYFK